MEKKSKRKDAIRGIIRDLNIKTQARLVEELHKLGYSCTQATVSRDIADLSLEKNSQGRYVLPEDLYLRRMLTDLVKEIVAAGNLVLIKTAPGTASGVAAALDDAKLKDVLGSVAGDDTVLAVCESPQQAELFISKIRNYQETEGETC